MTLEERQEELRLGAARRAQVAPRPSWPTRSAAPSCYGGVRRRSSPPSATVETLARIVAGDADRAAGADVGVLYVGELARRGALGARAVLGLDPARSTEHRGRGRGRGGAGRALSATSCRCRRRALRVRGARRRGAGRAGSCTCRWPSASERWAWRRSAASQDGFDSGESATVQRLAGQAAVALAEAGALAERDWLSQVNAAVLDGVREGIALVGLDHELVSPTPRWSDLADALAMPIAAGDRRRAASPRRYALRRLGDGAGRQRRADRGRAGRSPGVSLERYTAPVDDASGAGSAA